MPRSELLSNILAGSINRYLDIHPSTSVLDILQALERLRFKITEGMIADMAEKAKSK